MSMSRAKVPNFRARVSSRVSCRALPRARASPTFVAGVVQCRRGCCLGCCAGCCPQLSGVVRCQCCPQLLGQGVVEKYAGVVQGVVPGAVHAIPNFRAEAVAEVSNHKEPIGRRCVQFNWFQSQLISGSNKLRIR